MGNRQVRKVGGGSCSKVMVVRFAERRGIGSVRFHYSRGESSPTVPEMR